jgi:DNA-binding response OmpR family regulator
MRAPDSQVLARVLLLSEDDDVTGPLALVLERAGYAVRVEEGRGAVEALADSARDPAARPFDALILDRDLPPEQHARLLELLAPFAGRGSFPLLVLGGGPQPDVPKGWHEDAFVSVSKPLQTGEILSTLALLRRLVSYRRYRDLVHDLSQPVMTIHALSRSIAKIPVKDEAARKAIERFALEAERLMSLVEAFQRGRGPA